MKHRLKNFLSSTTAKLAVTYLLLIMLMSIGFSVVFYNASLNALHRQGPPDSAFHNQPFDLKNSQQHNTEVRDYLRKRGAEGQHLLLIRLLILNGTALVVGGGFSVYLARRSLRPIETAMEAQSQFVSDASHELRTPLTVIQTTNEVALRNKKLTLAEAKAVLSENTEEAIKLQQLSDGLLNLARQDHQPPKLTNVSVQTVTGEAMNHILTLAQAKKIGVNDATEHVQVMSNPAALRQILVILLDNAIKYSPAHTTVHITSAVKGSIVTLSVRDEGPGIRASDMPHLFRRFYRADAARSNGNQHGYGLGLAIADSLARHYNTTLNVQSQLGHGASFNIKLPRA